MGIVDLVWSVNSITHEAEQQLARVRHDALDFGTMACWMTVQEREIFCLHLFFLRVFT